MADESSYHRITMGPRLEAFCEGVGQQRQNDAERLHRKPHNNAPSDRMTGLAWHLLGSKCEGIGWSWLKPIKWHHEPKVDLTDVPDLEIGSLKIDVKGKRLDEHDLIVQLDDPEEWAYLLISAEYQPVYCIFGWLWGREARTFPVMELLPGRPAYVVKDKGLLRPPSDLYALTRGQDQLCHCGEYGSYSPNGRDWLCPEHSGLRTAVTKPVVP